MAPELKFAAPELKFAVVRGLVGAGADPDQRCRAP
jgi:hypothetical protein